MLDPSAPRGGTVRLRVPSAFGAPIDGMTLAYLAFVVFAWGSNYPLMKLALRDIGPLTFSAMRLIGGALFLGLIVSYKGRGPLWPARGERVRLAASGLLQYGGMLGFAGVGLMLLPAGRTSVAVYSMPLWAALFGAALYNERLTLGQWLGLAMGAGGLALFLDPSVFAEGSPIGIAFVFTAAASWGLGVVVHRGGHLVTPLVNQAFFQLVCSGAVLAVAASVCEHDTSLQLTPLLAGVMFWNWLVPTSLAVWGWTRVLSRLPAATVGQLLMATPLVGIACSALIFGEAVPLVFGASTALVIGGALLVLMCGRKAGGA